MELAGLLVAFVAIIIMITRKVNLGIAMFAGSILLAVFSPDIGLASFFSLFWSGVTNITTIEIVLVIINITIMASIMEKTGMIEMLIGALSILFKRYEITLALVPSIMGALAIPGGAMLSAPMVNSIAHDLNLDDSQKMAINMLYRHIWYFVFPFVPGLILAAGIIGVDVFYLIKFLFPFTIVLGIVGFLTLFRGIKKREGVTGAGRREKLLALLQVLLVLAPLLLGIFLPFFLPIPFWAGLSIGLILLLLLKRKEVSLLLVWQSIQWNLVLGILGIMVFREFINNLTALNMLAENISAAGMPIWLLAVIVPGLVAFITGSTSGAIGITFPLLVPLLPDVQAHMGYVSLMYGSAFFSYYISPVHFCLILTVEYFGVTLKETYRRLFLPTMAGIATMFILFWVY
ncbi:MAG: DUF401 family protein [Halanaerobium sp.]|nr:DUF401 family protein [Halanaerobium sp.]